MRDNLSIDVKDLNVRGVREREREGEREGGREGETERERDTCKGFWNP